MSLECIDNQGNYLISSKKSAPSVFFFLLNLIDTVLDGMGFNP